MSSDLSAAIMEHFTAQSRDTTPRLAKQTARLLYAPVSREPELTSHCMDIVSYQEQQRAQRFAAAHDRAHFLQRRVFRRFCAIRALGTTAPPSSTIFQETGKGRPYLEQAPELSFSFSSCPLGFLGAWSSTHRIGVDIEDLKGEIEPNMLADRFFSRAEASYIARTDDTRRLRTFLQFWTLKEAALKSIGEGLPYGLDAFEFELEPTPRVVTAPREHGAARRFEVHVIDTTDCCAALAIQGLAAGL